MQLLSRFLLLNPSCQMKQTSGLLHIHARLSANIDNARPQQPERGFQNAFFVFATSGGWRETFVLPSKTVWYCMELVKSYLYSLGRQIFP